MPDTILVTMRHARAASISGAGVLCADGIRGWCARHDIDLRQFVRNGIPVEQLEGIDDAFAARMAAVARQEAQRG
jgi:hypothetical protein